MKDFRANQKAFALFTTMLMSILTFVQSWDDTTYLLKLLQVFFLIGFYFFILFSFKWLAQFLASKEILKRYSIFSYYLEYGLKTFFLFAYIFAFTGLHQKIIGESEHVTDIYKNKCYKVGNFNDCYNYFQIKLSDKLNKESRKALDFSFAKCSEGNEKFCSQFIWMVKSSNEFTNEYKGEALEAAIQYKLLLTNKALMTEEYAVALSMNGKFEEAIEIQKQIIKFAKESSTIKKYELQRYQERLEEWEEMRKPASNEVKGKE